MGTRQVSIGGRHLAFPSADVAAMASTDPAREPAELRDLIDAAGYVLLRGFHPRAEVMRAADEVSARLAASGPIADGVEYGVIARRSASLMNLLYGDRVVNLFEALLDGPVRHYDFTWLRAYGRGQGTPPHMDSVFMNRGSHNVLTCWTPLGDVDCALGGLAVLEKSVRLTGFEEYAASDVDTYCEDDAEADTLANTAIPLSTGAITNNPVGFQRDRGRRWLTEEFEAGDIVIFGLFTVHAGLDNQTDRVRMSCDTRYQPATEPADERWIGERPAAHGTTSKKAVIC